MVHRTTLLMTEFVTHDVKRFIIKKPDTFSFKPGQGIEIVIDQDEWREEEGRPFTPTGLVNDKVLELIIKRYPGHKGVTDRMHTLKPGDNLLISEPFGAITYKGPGIFIAAGAGITPFLAIFRQLVVDRQIAQQSLIFTNKTSVDVICEKELRYYFGNRGHFLCTRESAPGYEHKRIDREYLQQTIDEKKKLVYVCGPKSFVEETIASVKDMGFSAESIVYEE